jgi:hypothetical protein
MKASNAWFFGGGVGWRRAAWRRYVFVAGYKYVPRALTKSCLLSVLLNYV